MSKNNYKPEKVTDEELMSLITSEISSNDYESRSAIKAQNADVDLMFANRYTKGTQPNSGVSSVLASTINPAAESLSSYLVNIFCSRDETVVFTSRDEDAPEKGKLAKLVSNIINDTIHYDNDGYSLISTWILDGFLHGTGIIQVIMEEKYKYDKWEFEGSEEELKAKVLELEGDGFDVDVIDQQKSVDTLTVTSGDSNEVLEMKQETIIATLKTSELTEVPTPENVPFEEFMINEGATSIHNDSKTRFVARLKDVYINELMNNPRFDHIDRDELFEVTGEDSADKDYAKAARHAFDGTSSDGSSDSTQGIMRRVEVTESFVRADRDGDGYAEWRHCFSVGTTLLDDEEWFGPLPFCHFTPFTVAHKFYGLKLSDKLKHYHVARTALLRAGVDTAVLKNIFRVFADPRHLSITDLKKNRHGVVPTLPGFQSQDVMNIPGPNGSPGDVLSMLNYLDAEVSAQIGLNYRTGVVSSEVEKSGNDAEKTAMTIDAASSRIEKYARDLAETGMTNLIWVLYEFMKSSGQVPGGLERKDLRVKVGLGHQTKKMKLQGAQAIIQQQQLLVQGGTPIPAEFLLNASNNLAKVLGEDDTTKFFPDSKAVEAERARMSKAAEEQQAQQMKMQEIQIEQQTQMNEATKMLHEAKAKEALVKAESAARNQELVEERAVVDIENVKQDNELNARRQEAVEEQMVGKLDLDEQKLALEVAKADDESENPNKVNHK